MINGRGERIRTFDPLVPNQMRYQAALRPDKVYSNRRHLCLRFNRHNSLTGTHHTNQWNILT